MPDYKSTTLEDERLVVEFVEEVAMSFAEDEGCMLHGTLKAGSLLAIRWGEAILVMRLSGDAPVLFRDAIAEATAKKGRL